VWFKAEGELLEVISVLVLSVGPSEVYHVNGSGDLLKIRRYFSKYSREGRQSLE
jgi:hypothetical protein